MPLRLSILASVSLLFASVLTAADEPKRNPNYTGPSAPTEILPEQALAADHVFAHPGILHSQSDFDFVRARLAAKEAPWTSALAAMRTSEFTQLAYKPRIIPVIDPHNNSVGYLMKDASAAYGHALLWAITGERAHADKAVEILDASGSQLVEIQLGRNDQGKVTAGFTGGKFASAAELIAHYRQPDGSTAGWPKESADRFRQMLLTVFYPRVETFKPTFNGNWDACMIATMMSLAVFCDDREKFNRAVAYYLNGQGHGALTHYIYAHGQNQESGRDQTHAQLGLGALAAACEIAGKQGLDLYSAAGYRLAAGYEYLAKYQTGHEVEMVGPVPISPHGRDNFMPIFEIAYQHYAIEKGLPMPFTREVVEHHHPEGLDLIILQAWGTLTHYRGPAIKPP
ncbi:MAG TPA: alginate lyase family protein [Rariglobus sp.]